MKTYFFIVDKEYGTSHSFIEGMIKKYLISSNNKSLIFFAKRTKNNIQKPILHNNSIESLFKRKGIQKILFSFNAFSYFLRNYPSEGNEVFIRNELVALLIFAYYKKIAPKKYTLSFQSSFPHEEASGNYLKTLVAKSIMSLSLNQTDKLYVVSDLAAKRLKKYISKQDIPIHIIPLCSDFPIRTIPVKRSGNLVKFVYIGTFSYLRQLDLLIKSFYQLKTEGVVNWRLEFYGGNKDEFITQYPKMKLVVHELLNLDLINFNSALKREDLVRELDQYHVGINLIPPIDLYLESSSTKLGEYMSRGLPVLSNCEIPYHQSIYSKGDIGWFCSFTQQSINIALKKIINSSNDDIENKSLNSLKVARDTLNYQAYLNSFK